MSDIHCMSETTASFLDRHRIIIDDEHDDLKFNIAVFRLTPTGLSTRWRVSKDTWCDIARNSKGAQMVTPSMRTQQILYSLYRLTHKLNQNMTDRVKRNASIARHAFLLVDEQSTIGDWNHGILRALLFDSIAWATLPFTPTTCMDGYPHQAETADPSASQNAQLARVWDAYKNWPTTVTNFVQAWKVEAHVSSVSPPTGNIKEIVTALYEGTTTKTSNIIQRVKANFCSASLGLMIIVLGKEAGADDISFDGFVKQTGANISRVKWTRYLCTIYSSAALSPLCLLANFRQSHSGSTNMPLQDLAGLLSTARVEENNTMKKIEYDCFSIILAICRRGPSAFDEEVRHAMGRWESASQEIATFPTTRWDALFDQVKKQRCTSWQIYERLRDAVKNNEKVDDEWFAGIASTLMNNSNPEIPPKTDTLAAHPDGFSADAGPNSQVDSWLSLISLQSQASLDALFPISLAGTGIGEGDYATYTPQTEHTEIPFDDWAAESMADITTTVPVDDGWFSSYIPATSHPVPVVTNADLQKDVYTRPHVTSARGSIPTNYLTATTAKVRNEQSTRTVREELSEKIREWPGMAHEIDMLNAIMSRLHDCRDNKLYVTTRREWEAASVERKKECFATWPSLVISSPNTLERNVCVTDQVDSTVQRPALDMSIASEFPDQESARRCRLSLEEFLQNDDETNEKVSAFYLQEEWLHTGHHVGKEVEELDDVSRYSGHHDPIFTWKTEVHSKDMGASWFTAASKDVISRPRMTASGLSTVLKQLTGKTIFYIADHTPPLYVDEDWDCSAVAWSTVLIAPGDVLYMRPGTVYATVTTETGLFVGTHFYCTDTLERTLRALVRSGPIAIAGIHSVGYKRYDKAIISLFKLLHAWVTGNGRQNVADPAVVCSLLLIVENADCLVQYALASTPEFATDFAYARRLIRRYWTFAYNRCETMYATLQAHEASLRRLVDRTWHSATRLRSLTDSAPGSLKSVD